MPVPDSEAQRILAEVFGYAAFRAGQAEVVDALLHGESALTVMPTGAGKSLCFQIPALVKGGLTVVVSPLVALMEDQVAALRLAGVAAETINSSRERPVNVASWRRVAAGETRLLYLAPERLMTAPMLEALSQLPVKLIAVDEAHCISQWGPSFRPEYEALSQLRERFPNVPIAALTATADPATRDDIVAKLFGGGGRLFVRNFDRPNIRLNVTQRRDWKRQLLDFVQAHQGESGIVYCLSRKKTEEAAALLQENGVRALAYHAGLDAYVRSQTQDVFMTEPGIVMTATIAFGMGIDKPDLRYVFHANLPGSMEAYYQEIGRAGRDGAPAEAHMLFGLDDIRMRRMFIDQEDADEAHKRRAHKRLDMLIAYAEAPECRRRVLLAYFGDTVEACGNCDVCIDPPKLADGSTLAKQILEAVHETGQRFGAAHIVDVLRGANTEKIRGAGHDKIGAHGIGQATGKPEWRSIIRQMVAAELLELDVAGYGGLAVSQKGWGVAEGTESFHYRPDTAAPERGSKSAKSSKAGKSSVPEVTLTSDEEDLFIALKARRLDLARERDVPAFVIFPDRTLIDMARRKPRNETEFAEVRGVGAAKLRDFAAPFLEVISALPSGAV